MTVEVNVVEIVSVDDEVEIEVVATDGVKVVAGSVALVVVDVVATSEIDTPGDIGDVVTEVEFN